ncbi:MAG: hypothetical protein H6993_01515 [Pseudomonadales bacterium]|nr:hypothetical protein [Pseudomonadales bacterium]
MQDPGTRRVLREERLKDAEKVPPELVSPVVGFADLHQMQRFPLHLRASHPWLAYQAAFSAAAYGTQFHEQQRWRSQRGQLFIRKLFA